MINTMSYVAAPSLPSVCAPVGTLNAVRLPVITVWRDRVNPSAFGTTGVAVSGTTGTELTHNSNAMTDAVSTHAAAAEQAAPPRGAPR